MVKLFTAEEVKNKHWKEKLDIILALDKYELADSIIEFQINNMDRTKDEEFQELYKSNIISQRENWVHDWEEDLGELLVKISFKTIEEDKCVNSILYRYGLIENIHYIEDYYRKVVK